MAKKYVNRSQYYSYNGMVSRTQLAVIDQNCNVGKGESTTALEMSATLVCLSKATETVGRKTHIQREDISVCP